MPGCVLMPVHYVHPLYTCGLSGVCLLLWLAGATITGIFCDRSQCIMSLTKQQFVLTHWYSFLLDTEKTGPFLGIRTLTHVTFSGKCKESCGHNILTESVFVTELHSNGWNPSLTKCMGYDKLLFLELYTSTQWPGQKMWEIMMANTVWSAVLYITIANIEVCCTCCYSSIYIFIILCNKLEVLIFVMLQWVTFVINVLC
jgi:hypothetical protein